MICGYLYRPGQWGYPDVNPYSQSLHPRSPCVVGRCVVDTVVRLPCIALHRVASPRLVSSYSTSSSLFTLCVACAFACCVFSLFFFSFFVSLFSSYVSVLFYFSLFVPFSFIFPFRFKYFTLLSLLSFVECGALASSAASPPVPMSVLQCATIVQETCPTCRTPFVAPFNVPDPRVNPARWFHIVDFDRVQY